VSQPDPLNAVVVGYGYAGRCFHAYLIGITPGLRLHGIVSGREDVRAQITADLQIRTYAELKEALTDPDVDLIVLATPNDLHMSQAVAALDAGKHVVTDKPMCLSIGEAERMITTADKAGRLLSVFQNRRWDGDFLTVQDLLGQGAVGTPYYIEMAWEKFSPPRTWRGSRSSGGGVFVDLCSHMIDQALLLAAPATLRTVYARFFNKGWNTDVEDFAQCLLSFSSGLEVQMTASARSRAIKPRWYALGTEGGLLKHGLDPQEKAMVAGDIDAAREEDDTNHLRVWRVQTKATGAEAPDSRPQAAVSERVIPPQAGRWRCYYENIAAAINAEAELIVRPQQIRQVVRVMEAAFESARTDAAVSFEA
jgi:scyllo-inositol 2-dehydrogenase (NADP+)